MKRTALCFALPIFLASTTVSGEELFQEAERCGDPIRKKQVTVVDVRDTAGDLDSVAASLWEQIGPFTMIRGGEVTPHESKSSSKVLKNEKRSAAELGCDVLIISDTTRLASMASKSRRGTNQIEENQVVSFYGCRWASEAQPNCPIPEKVLEEFERQQIKSKAN